MIPPHGPSHRQLPIKDWMAPNNATIMTMIVLFLVLGLKILGDGIAGL
jgi:hypothetical protein